MTRGILKGLVGRAALSASMGLSDALLLKPLLAAAERPHESQTEALRKIVAANADTAFGRRFDFRRIRTLADWRRAVPVHSFEDLRPWIERQAESAEPCLTAEPPVMYNLTSGTTAKPKLVPVTRSGIARIKREQRIFACAMHAFDPAIFSGRVVGLGAPAVEGWLPKGIPFGSATGRIYREMPAAIRARYVLPAEAFEIPDYESRYRVIAAYLLADGDVTIASTANPSTLLRLLTVIRTHLDALLADLEHGSLSIDSGLPRAADDILRRGLREGPARARTLARLAAKRPLTFADIWPRLRAVATWMGGSCGIALEALRAELGDHVRIIEVGYASSEFRGSINIEPARNLCLPTLREIVFEFVDAAEAETEDATFLGLHEIEDGRQYRVFATTPDGLYRYDINDIVEVVGRVGRTPALAFVQKGRGVTSITGEKLHESQMSEALAAVCAEAGLRPVFYLALAEEQAAEYRVHLQAEGDGFDAADLARKLDQALMARNLEYRAKRASARLREPVVIRLQPGTAEAYRRHCIAAGQRDSQFKVMPLRYAREVDFDLGTWRMQA